MLVSEKVCLTKWKKKAGRKDKNDVTGKSKTFLITASHRHFFVFVLLFHRII